MSNVCHRRVHVRRMAGCIGVAFGILLCVVCTGCKGKNCEVVHSSITYDGLQRTCRLYIPGLYYERSSCPLVVALHGAGSTGDDMATVADFEDLADTEGFLVLLPDGYEKNWNDGRDAAGIAAYDLNIDDVGFINALVDAAAANYNVDTTRIYLAGMSNGAMMTYRIGCETPARFAAFACVVGAIPENIFGACSPTGHAPFVIFNSTDDPLVPWEGGECGTAEVPLGRVVSIQESVQFWALHNGFVSEPEATLMEDVDPNDGTRVTEYSYTNGEAEADVVFYGIDGGGHTWPGGPAIQVLWGTGPVCNDIDGTSIIWSFFKAHKRS